MADDGYRMIVAASEFMRFAQLPHGVVLDTRLHHDEGASKDMHLVCTAPRGAMPLLRFPSMVGAWQWYAPRGTAAGAVTPMPLCEQGW